MDIQRINQYKTSFDSIAQSITDDNGEPMEVWYARELQPLLGYARWENFSVAVKRAVESCKTQGINTDDHFREVTKMIPAKRPKGLFAQAVRRSLLLSPPGGLFFIPKTGGDKH